MEITLKGKKVAILATNMMNAGTNRVDEEVIVDKGLVTSSSPKKPLRLLQKMIEELKETQHE